MYDVHTQYVHLTETACRLCMADMGFLIPPDQKEGTRDPVDPLKFLWSAFEGPKSAEEQKIPEESCSRRACEVSFSGTQHDR